MSEAHPTQGSFRGRILDRLRLQFLGSGNWRTAIANSELPEEVQTTIRDVVEQTGLLRFEKSEITSELIHHFQDGHEHGHTYDELIRDFGKTDVAVSLFRSSKLRSRPMSVKAFRGSMIVFGGGLIGYLLLQLFFHSAKPNPSVDYAAKLNEAVTSMPVEQQAWPLYRESWTKFGLAEGAGEYFKEFFVEEDEYSRLIRPSDENWNVAVAKLESLEELLAVLKEGAKLPHLGTPLHVDRSKYSDADFAALFPNQSREQADSDSNDFEQSFGLVEGAISDEADKLLAESTMNVLLPHIQQFRQAARILRVDTRLAVQQGDSERAIENVRAIMGLGNQAGECPILVCALVGRAVWSIGMGLVEELVVEHPDFLEVDQLEKLQNIVAEVKLDREFDLSCERDFFMDVIQRTYSDDGDGDGRMTAVGAEVLFVASQLWIHPSNRADDWTASPTVRALIDPMKMFTAPSRKEMVSLFEETIDELTRHLKTKMWEDCDFDADAYVEEKDPTGFIANYGLSVSQFKQSREIKIARQDAVVLALAIHRYKLANEKWPTSLDQLTGKWIDRTPIDRISGKPLSFVTNDDGVVVYSKGHDGDDDGGRALELSEPHWLDKEGNGDWILWPTNER